MQLFLKSVTTNPCARPSATLFNVIAEVGNASESVLGGSGSGAMPVGALNVTCRGSSWSCIPWSPVPAKVETAPVSSDTSRSLTSVRVDRVGKWNGKQGGACEPG